MTLDALLVAWAAKYDVETVLERIVGRGASACDSLATRGKRVVVTRDDADRETATFDLVVVHGDDPTTIDWRTWLAALGKRAGKLVVVEAPNPRQPSRLARWMGATNGAASWGATSSLAPVLWEIGRVREHAVLDTAARHAFVIDVTPRTPQARRKVRLSGA